MHNGSLSPICASIAFLYGQITSTCHSSSFSPISPSLFPPFHPYSSAVIELVQLTIAFHRGWTHKSTQTHNHRFCACNPFTWLNASILWLQIDRWLDRWTNDPWWTLFLNGMVTGKAEDTNVFQNVFFSILFIALPQFSFLPHFGSYLCQVICKYSLLKKDEKKKKPANLFVFSIVSL